MPRTPKAPKSGKEIKPYIRSSTSPSPQSSDPLPEDATPPSTPAKAKQGKARGWSNNELVKLFETVAKAGAGKKVWEGAVEGRTPNQCYQAWM